jgi:hypothetical protein
MRMGGLIGGGEVGIRGAECCRQVTVESPAALWGGKTSREQRSAMLTVLWGG